MTKGTVITVRTSSPLSVDVSELLRHPGATKRLRFTQETEGLRLPLARVEPGAGLEFDVRLDALVDGIHVAGTVSGTVSLDCRRCLTATTEAVQVEVDELFLASTPFSGGEADSSETTGIDADAYVIEDEHVDLEPMARDAIVLALPLNPLCREDCKGLCPTCGADRNETDCGHTAERIDIRWGPLERLRERMEE